LRVKYSTFGLLYFFVIGIFPGQFQPSIKQIASHYAPVHVQYVTENGKNSLNGKSDYLSSVDFDGDWNASNNWENAETSILNPSVYYSVVSTTSHHFIQYVYFHPRDWTRTPFTKLGQHENDLEGILLVVWRDSTTYGKCVGAMSIFHHQILLYTSLEYMKFRTPHFQSVALPLQKGRPVSAQQTKGHGCKAYGDMRNQGQRIILYLPENEETESIKLPAMRVDSISYTLIDIFEKGGLWEQRYNQDFFATDQSINGDNGVGAKPPWLWQSSRWKTKYPEGAIALHPAQIAFDYFSFGHQVDTVYTFNLYRGIK
jgi:hypothetical protein